MENPIADLVESQISNNGPRMPFESQCAYFAALNLGVSNAAVSIASGLAPSTVTFLAKAGTVIGGQLRYPKVALEYDQLGHDAFVHTYLTAKIRDRLAVAIADVNAKRSTPRRVAAIRPNAQRFAGRHDVTASDGTQWAFVVKWTDSGWRYAYALEPGRGEIKPEHMRWRGDATRDDRGFSTSTDAYRVPIGILEPRRNRPGKIPQSKRSAWP